MVLAVTLGTPLALSCIGEGNGNPLQCSCLENPRDGGAWWAAVYGVALSSESLGAHGKPEHPGESSRMEWEVEKKMAVE